MSTVFVIAAVILVIVALAKGFLLPLMIVGGLAILIGGISAAMK